VLAFFVLHFTEISSKIICGWHVIFDIRALRRSALSVRVPGCQKLQVIS